MYRALCTPFLFHPQNHDTLGEIMSAPIVQSDYTRLEEIAARFKAQAALTTSTFYRVRHRVEVLHEKGWSGHAADAFHREMTSVVLPAIQRLISSLEDGSVTVLRILEVLKAAEHEAAALFNEHAKPDAPGIEKGLPLMKDISEAGSKGPLGKQLGEPLPKPPLQPHHIFLNGINSEGAYLDYNADDQVVFMMKAFEKYGYPENLLHSTPPMFTSPTLPQLSGTSLTGTTFGGRLSGVDWLTGILASGTNETTGEAANLFNENAARLLNQEAARILYGIEEVRLQYISGEAYYAQRQADYIDSLGLDKNRPLILHAHSGAGSVIPYLAANLAERGYNISGLVTHGSPVSNYDFGGRYADLIVDIQHVDDRFGAPFGRGLIRSDEARYFLPLLPNLPPHIGIPGAFLVEEWGRRNGDQPNVVTITLDTPVDGIDQAHGSYMHDSETSLELLRRLNELFPLGLDHLPPPVR
jgi:WXG100 family type VII secretion target